MPRLLAPVSLALLLFVSGLWLASTAAAAGAAQGLTVTQECVGEDESSLRLSFSWTSGQSGSQWLDLSFYDDGFQPSTRGSAGPFDAAIESFVWDNVAQGRQHYARINTLSEAGWLSSPTISFQTQVCTPPGQTPPGPGLLDLQARLADEIAASGIDAAVAVTDLQTGEQISVNGDAARWPGCTINFFVMLSVVQDLQQGLYEESRAGDLISRTIYSSNPVTARDLLLISGGGDLDAAIEKVKALMAGLGMTASYYDHAPGYPWETTAGRSNILTANETNRALAAFWRGEVVSLDWRDYLLAKMVEVKPGLQYLLPAGVSGGTVSHKNGFLPLPSGWVDNDIGIVTFQRGGQTYAYAISFFTQDVPVKYADIPLGQTVSSMVWQYFSAAY